MNDKVLLYREKGSQAFMSNQEPLVRYDLTCGHCDYPIKKDHTTCPRCQLELEKCPICSDLRHSRAPRTLPDPSLGIRTCPMCGLRRIPFGAVPLAKLNGAFCTNLFGCSAGGLLLENEEMAVLPPGPSRCMVCRHPRMLPLDIRTFEYHINRCLFCLNCFRPRSRWIPGWAASLQDPVVDIEKPPDQPQDTCPLCGRNDQFSELSAGKVRWNDRNAWITSEVTLTEGSEKNDLAFRRMVELGRLLVFIQNDQELFEKSFAMWFDPSSPGDRRENTSLSVREVIEMLIETTADPIHKKILVGRTQRLLESWSRNLRGGLDYRIPLSKP